MIFKKISIYVLIFILIMSNILNTISFAQSNKTNIQQYNILDKEYGNFTQLDNIDTRTIREDIYDEMINLYKSNLGLTDYWAKALLDDYSGLNLETENYADSMVEAISDKVPYLSMVPGFSGMLDKAGLTDSINGFIAKYGDLYREYDLRKESIHPLNRLEPSKAIYTVPITNQSPFVGDYIQGHLTYTLYEGDQDHVDIYLVYEKLDGEIVRVKEEEMLKTVYEKELPTMTKEVYQNGKRAFDYGYEFLLKNVSTDNIKNIQLVIDSGYNLPKQPSIYLSEKLTPRIIDLSTSSLSNSVSNILLPDEFNDFFKDNKNAIHSSSVSEKIESDLRTLFEKSGIDEQMCNTNYSELITEKSLSSVPYLGQMITYIPNLDKKISEFIALVIEEEDIQSRIDVTNLNLTFSSITKDKLPYNNNIGFENRNWGNLDFAEDIFLPLTLHHAFHGLRKPNIIREVDTNNTNVFETKYINSGMYWLENNVTNTGPKSVIRNSYCEDFTLYATLKTTPHIDSPSEYGDMGMIFRASDVWYNWNGKDNFNGYYAALNVEDNSVYIGKFIDKEWQMIKSAPIIIDDGVEYKVKVEAEGSKIKFYVNDMENSIVEINDDTYDSGFIGVRSYTEKAERSTIYDDILLQVESTELNSDDNIVEKGQMLPFNIAAVEYATNKEHKIDLTGNGSKETIFIDNKSAQKTIKIGYFPVHLSSHSLLKPDEFWIIDIDPNDAYKELVYFQSYKVDWENKNQYVVYSYAPSKSIGASAIGNFDKIIAFGDSWISGEIDGKIVDMILTEDRKLVLP